MVRVLGSRDMGRNAERLLRWLDAEELRLLLNPRSARDTWEVSAHGSRVYTVRHFRYSSKLRWNRLVGQYTVVLRWPVTESSCDCPEYASGGKRLGLGGLCKHILLCWSLEYPENILELREVLAELLKKRNAYDEEEEDNAATGL